MLATRSAGKLRELRPMFAAHGLDVVDLRDLAIPETVEEDRLEAFETFEENALAKARYFFDRTQVPTVADDSGLVVRALNGAPGVRSKRWSGRSDLSGQTLDDENNRLLLSALGTAVDRAASYVCAAAYVDGRRAFTTRGEVDGEIAFVARGTNGFGYDPYFVATELGRTFGEADPDVKEAVSHRGRAFRELIARIALRGAQSDESAS